MESLARRNSRRIVTEKSINCIVHLKEVQFIFYKTIEIIIRLEITYVHTTYRIYACVHTYIYRKRHDISVNIFDRPNIEIQKSGCFQNYVCTLCVVAKI